MDDPRHMTDRELRDKIISQPGQYVLDEVFYDDDCDDVSDAWPRGWWILTAVVISLLFWVGASGALWILIIVGSL